MNAPTTSAEFDKAYRAPITFWGDIRIPAELKELIRRTQPKSALELGCGVGRLSQYAARKGVSMTGVDFSPVAIGEAKKRTANDAKRPTFTVGDVTNLSELNGPYDMAFDVGCFHCLNQDGQRAYAKEMARLIKPAGTHLLWTLDAAPSDERLTPETIAAIFKEGFTLSKAEPSRRRLVRSHWYWLTRKA